MSDRSLIVAGVRTPIGAMNGALASVPAPELGRRLHQGTPRTDRRRRRNQSTK